MTLVAFAAGKEFRGEDDSTEPVVAQQCQLLLRGRLGWYHSILMLDDFSRFVLASDLKPDMTAHSISNVVEQAVAFTGMRRVPAEETLRLKMMVRRGSESSRHGRWIAWVTHDARCSRA